MSACTVPECGQPIRYPSHGVCVGHYQQIHRGAELSPLKIRNKGRACTFDGCRHPAASKGWCKAHHAQVIRGGSLKELRGAHRRGYVGAGGYLKVKIDKKIVSIHRLVMEEKIGRPLLPGESVHHINGDRIDNRPENLELWSTAQPAGQRIPDKVAWAQELLRTYAPHLLAEVTL